MLVGAAGPALAGSDLAAITAPPDGGTYFDTTPPPAIDVDWSDVADPANIYRVSASTGGVEVSACSYTGSDVVGEVTSCSLPPTLAAGTYTVAVANVTAATTIDSASFTVVERIDVESTTVDPGVFFPFERDGFRRHSATSSTRAPPFGSPSAAARAGW
jgi:hypothetical protein